MLIQGTTYSVYPKAGVYYILTTEDITVNVYDYTDTSYVTPLIIISALNGVETSLELCEDGRYTLQITNGVFTDNNLFVYFPFFQTKTINEIYSFICNCENCTDSILNNCDDCMETDDYKSNLSFMSYLFSHIYLFTDQTYNQEFATYMTDLLLNYHSKLYQRYKNMFWYGITKGIYPIALKDIAVYYSSIYMYYYYLESYEDSDSDYVDTKYNITAFKACMDMIGISYTEMEIAFNNRTIIKGKYYVTDLTGIVDKCTEIFDLTFNPSISLVTYETGININIVTNPQNVMLIIPTAWGALTEILDGANANLITDTTRTECGNFYIYTFNYQLPPNTYTFKIVI